MQYGLFWARWRPIVPLDSESFVEVWLCWMDGSPARSDKGLDKKLCSCTVVRFITNYPISFGHNLGVILMTSWPSKSTLQRLLNLAGLHYTTSERSGPFWQRNTESWSRAVELEWQGTQEAQSLPGWAVGDVLSYKPRCLPGSLWFVQLPLDHLIEKRDRAVCHQCNNGRKSHVPVWWDPVDVVYVEKRRGTRTDPWGNPSDQLMCFGYLPSPGHSEIPTSEYLKPAYWNPSDAQWWEGGQEDLMIDRVKSGRLIQQNEDWWFGIGFYNSQVFSDWE